MNTDINTSPSIQHYLRPIIVGLTLFALIDLGIGFSPLTSWLDARVDNPLSLKLEQLAQRESARTEKDSAPDMLFIGSSRTFNGFDPVSFESANPDKTQGIKIYNYGMPATEFDFFKLLLKDYLSSHQKPKTVLVEVADFMLIDSFSTHPLYYQKLIANHSDLLQPVLNETTLSKSEKARLLASLVSSVYRYNGTLSPLLLLQQSIGPTHSTTAAKKGTEKLGSITQQGWQPLKANPMLINPSLWTIDHASEFRQQSMTHRLEAFLKYCQIEGIKVILIDWPDTPQYRQQFDQTHLGQVYQTQLTELSKRYKFKWLNLNTPEALTKLGLNHSDYADLRHLNHSGAQKISQSLAQMLTKDIFELK